MERLRESASEIRPIYVACFSEEGDSLSQWRAYAGGEGGYAIGLTGLSLSEAAKLERGSNLWQCLNSKADHKVLLTEALVAAENAYLKQYKELSADPRAFEASVKDALYVVTRLAPVLKHPAFKEEREWRIVVERDFADVAEVQFVAADAILRPFIRVNLCIGNGNALPLKEIRVGPARLPDLSMESVRQLLQKSQYRALVPVKKSAVPFRQI
jgi:hypothetical protein